VCRQALEAVARHRDQLGAAAQALGAQVQELQGQLVGWRQLQAAHQELQAALAAATKDSATHQQARRILEQELAGNILISLIHQCGVRCDLRRCLHAALAKCLKST